MIFDLTTPQGTKVRIETQSDAEVEDVLRRFGLTSPAIPNEAPAVVAEENVPENPVLPPLVPREVDLSAFYAALTPDQITFLRSLSDAGNRGFWDEQLEAMEGPNFNRIFASLTRLAGTLELDRKHIYQKWVSRGQDGTGRRYRYSIAKPMKEAIEGAKAA